MITRALCGAILAALTAVSAQAAPPPLADPPWRHVTWGETSGEIAGAFGKAATRLRTPIEFGDSYVDVVLRDQRIGGYPFTLYFQMDKTDHRLKRLMYERQRHGANPRVFRAVMAELEQDYGPPTLTCNRKSGPRNGFQAGSERIWRQADVVIRAVLRDTTLEASEGCLQVTTFPCGLTGQLFLQVAPRGTGANPEGCG